MVGIHTPEFDFEKKRARVVAAAKRFELDHPIMMDNDNGYWNRLGNTYWPAFYLVDQRGKILTRIVGETHAGTAQAKAMEDLIHETLKAG